MSIEIILTRFVKTSIGRPYHRDLYGLSKDVLDFLSFLYITNYNV